jgi:hypothetical protein
VLAAPSPASAWENDLGEVSLFETGGLSPRTLDALDTLATVLGVEPTIIQSGTIRMTAVERGVSTIQSFEPGFAVPMSFLSVDPEATAPLLGSTIAAALSDGMVMSEATAALRGAMAGDEVTVEGWDGSIHRLTVSAVVPDASIQWTELVMSHEVAAELGISRPARAVMWGVNTTMVELLMRTVLPDAPLGVRGPGSQGPRGVDGVLPMVLVKERFGEFSFRQTGTDRIETDDDWFEANIVTVTLPRLGLFRCHKDVLPYLRGALLELEATGLAEEIDPADFQAAGGCYNARLARGGDLDRGLSISRHSWGIAVDFNPSTNRFGQQTSLSEEFGQVLRSWGFAWGAGWRIPDPMHFEWRSVPVDGPRQACADRLAGALELGEPPPARTCRL